MLGDLSVRELAQLVHDMNNALQISIIRMDMALLSEDGPWREHLARAKAAGHVAASLGRQALSLAPQLMTQQHRLVELNTTIQKAAADYGDILLGIEVRVAASSAHHLWTRLHYENLMRALVNLIMNAKDAMPPAGGVLTLGATLQEEGRKVCIQVRDNGIGMDEETRRRCLETGFTTKGERGTGLGLSIVKHFVDEHAGTLIIRTAPGQGTTIEMCFARVDV